MRFLFSVFFYFIVSASLSFAAESGANKLSSGLIIELTDHERKIANQRKYKVAITDYPPFVYYDYNNDSYYGIAIQTLKTISKKTGLKFEFVEYANLQDTINAVKDGKADITFSASFFSSLIQKTDSYFTRKAYIVVARQNKNYWTDLFLNANEDSKLSMVTVRGSVFSRLAQNLNVKIRVIDVNTQIEALIRVAIGDADFTLMDSSTFGYYQNKLSTNALVLAESSQVFEVVSNFGLSNNLDPSLINVFNKGINSINKKENELIEEQWKQFIYKEPLMRVEFLILIITLCIFVIVNVIWYKLMIRNLKRQEQILSERWIASVSEAIENERQLLQKHYEKQLKNQQNNFEKN